MPNSPTTMPNSLYRLMHWLVCVYIDFFLLCVCVRVCWICSCMCEICWLFFWLLYIVSSVQEMHYGTDFFIFIFVSDMLGEILSVSVLRLAEDSPPFVGYVCVCVCVCISLHTIYIYINTHTMCTCKCTSTMYIYLYTTMYIYLYTHYIYVHNIHARTQRAVEHRV